MTTTKRFDEEDKARLRETLRKARAATERANELIQQSEALSQRISEHEQKRNGKRKKKD